jgi:hypothetical protein
VLSGDLCHLAREAGDASRRVASSCFSAIVAAERVAARWSSALDSAPVRGLIANH